MTEHLSGVGGNEALKASRSPGQAIRSELVAAAAELTSPAGSYPTEASTRAIRRHFRAHSAALQMDLWPLVSVKAERHPLVYPAQPRTLRIIDQRGGSVCLTSPSIQ